MNAWEKTCDTWRLLAAEIDGTFFESKVPFTETHLATVEKQYKNWKISFQSTGHTITGNVSYVPLANFTLHVKRKRFDWTDEFQNLVPPLFMFGSQVTGTGFDEVEYLYSILSNDTSKARTIMQNPALRDVLVNCDGMQNFVICSMKVASIDAGSILIFDLGRVSDRPQMKSRFEVLQQSLDQLVRLGLASKDAPQTHSAQDREDLFSYFNFFKKR